MNRQRRHSRRRLGGFTLVEVLVALMVVAMGLMALMITVSGTARTSGYLRDKTLAQWIALNRLTEVRLNISSTGQSSVGQSTLGQNAATQSTAAHSNDTGDLYFANRNWHYDTRYFDTSFASMKRVVVRVYLGDSKTQGNPIVETTGFLGTSLSTPAGTSNTTDWNPPVTTTQAAPNAAATSTPATTTPLSTTPTNPGTVPITTNPTPAPNP